MGLGKTLVVAPLLCALAACGTATASNNDTSTNAVAPVTTNGTTVATVSDPTAFKVGTNVSTVQYWDGSRPFMNLIYGGQFLMQNTNPWGGAENVPAADLDANGWVKSVPAGYRVLRALSIPVAGGNFICRFQGNGAITVSSGPASNVVSGTGQTTFTIAPATYPNPAFVTLAYSVDPSNYIRNIDCRETTASNTELVAPEWANAAKGFKVMRFMKWALAGVEHNSGVTAAWAGGTQAKPNYLITWSNRTKPGDGDYTANDGVPVEVMVQMANELGVDPWFAMPWNADDDYITRYATYVRDNLAQGHQVYVEESNEVWNGFYPVHLQAVAEGEAEGLDGAWSGAYQQGLERYAEKAAHVMDIWSSVFAATGQSSQLVRVAAWQHVNPGFGDMLLKYNDAYKHFDAYATAPYFGAPIDGDTVDEVFNTVIPAAMTDAMNYAAQNKALAAKYGLRYVGYEAGQGFASTNVTFLSQVEHDPRMQDVYKTYLTQWQQNIGDTITLFTLTAPVSTYGGFGMWDYAGQPLSESPKMQAVQQFLGISTTTASTTGNTTPTTSTITCPDGTVILSTSTCPTTTTTSSGSTSGTTTGGKKNGSTKGGGKGGKTATV